MKIEDGPLKSYLIKNLESATEADPALLANYVIALLKNNKPKKELQKLCTDNLLDFLGEGTKQFVVKLFNALETGSISIQEAPETSKPLESETTAPPIPASQPAAAEAVEVKTSPVPANNKPGLRHSDAEESSDDEDDDRNHKHRRPRSRSFDRDVEEDERSYHRKRSRSNENGGQYNRGNYHHQRRYRGREYGLTSRIVADGNSRGGIRSGYRGDSGPRFFASGPQRGIGRGRGGLGNNWLPPEQRFGVFPDGSDFSSVLLPQAPTASGIFASRVSVGRGGPQPQWAGFSPIQGIGNGAPLEHVIPLAAGRGSAVNPGVGMNLVVPLRARCSDFEERGYCLRGDLCPMEHGANRIVVEDVQSISKLTLPVRNGATGSSSAPSAGIDVSGRPVRASREVGEEGNAGNNTSDLYDPDQPLWSRENSQAQQGYNLSESGLEEASLKANETKGLDSGVSVWDRIGPVDPRFPGSAAGKVEQASAEQAGAENGQVQAERPHVHRGAEGTTSYGGRAERGEKGQAQRTLYVRCIPTELNKSDSLRAHFQKFGEVLDVRIPPHSDRAFVQFVRREDAEAALVSPEAVMGNRFIKTSWANRDNRVDFKAKAAAAAAAGPGNKANAATAGEVKRSSPTASAAQLQKKQEELEQMKEEIRKKQEALAQKRDEFKKKLEKLAKQEAPAAVKAEASDAGEDTKQAAGAAKPLTKSPVPRPAPPSAAAAAAAWGPGRYKLDNRTTTFRVVAPPPTDVGDLKAHFGAFGELSSLEASDEGNIQVTYASRRDAEKGFTQGRFWQGQALQVSWVNVAPRGPAVAGNSSTTQPEQQPEQPASSEEQQQES